MPSNPSRPNTAIRFSRMASPLPRVAPASMALAHALKGDDDGHAHGPRADTSPGRGRSTSPPRAAPHTLPRLSLRPGVAATPHPWRRATHPGIRSVGGARSTTPPRGAAEMSALSPVAERNSLEHRHAVMEHRRELELLELSTRREKYERKEQRRRSILQAMDDARAQLSARSVRQREVETRLAVVEARLLEERERREAAFAEHERRREAATVEHARLLNDKRQTREIERAHHWRTYVVLGVAMGKMVQVYNIHDATNKLKKTFTPILRRRIAVMAKHRERAVLTEARLKDNQPPTPFLLQKQVAGDFFRHWSDADLKELIQALTPRTLVPGEFLIMEGDVDRVLYIMTRGECHGFMKKADATGRDRKRRCDANAAATWNMSAPNYVGEFALMSLEPRSASIRCSTEVDVWSIDIAKFNTIRRHLSPKLLEELDHVTNERRQRNLNEYFRPRLDFIIKHPVFHSWNPAHLQQLLDALRPIVLTVGKCLMRDGDNDDRLFFVSDGELLVWHGPERFPPDHARVLHRGDSLGDYEVFFGVDRREYSASTLHRTDVWYITRQQLWDVGLSMPQDLIDARRIVLDRQRQTLVRPPAAFFSGLSVLRSVLPTAAAQWAIATAQPAIFTAREVILQERSAARHIVVVTEGAVAVTYHGDDLQHLSNTFYAGQAVPEIFAAHTIVGAGVSVLPQLRPGGPAAGSPSKAEQAVSPSTASAPPSRGGRRGSSGGLAADETTLRLPGYGSHMHQGCIVLGAIEFASRSPLYVCTAVALQNSSAWVIDRDALEERLPASAAALASDPNFVRRVIAAFASDGAEVAAASPTADSPSAAAAASAAAHAGRRSGSRSGKRAR